MAESNFILFKRDEQDPESHEDVWDDTALIQAYDRAVNLAKEKVSAQLGLNEEANASSTTNELPNGDSPKKHNWKVGDYVRSIYSEDGIVYEAIIKKMKPPHSCLLKYLGYENEEVVLLKDLEPSAGPVVRNQQIAASADVASSDADMDCEVPFQPSSKPTQISGLDWQPVKPDTVPGINQMAMPSFPGMGQMSIPPPPPPAAWPTHGSSEMDPDSLYSMLMSWYMCGYQTGYYQGVQHRNKRGNNSGTS